MRFLTVVRHAKAVPAEGGVNDFDRVLTEKGRAQAEILRQWACDPETLGAYGPATALVSAAARTRETYALAFAGTPFVHAVETSELIYNGRRDVSAHDVLVELAAIDPVSESLLVVAHNPTVYDLVTLLSKSDVEELAEGKYPLCGAFVFRLKDEPVGLRRYELVDRFIPKV